MHAIIEPPLLRRAGKAPRTPRTAAGTGLGRTRGELRQKRMEPRISRMTRRNNRERISWGTETATELPRSAVISFVVVHSRKFASLAQLAVSSVSVVLGALGALAVQLP